MQRVLKGSFAGKGSDGRDYVVEQWVDIVDVHAFDGGGLIPSGGVGVVRTADGTELIHLKKGHYLHFAASVVIVSDDPNAP